MGEYIAKDITDYRAQASSIFSKVKTLFNDNNLKLPKSTSIEIRGQNKKKEYVILALFSSISEAKTFEHQAAEGRRKNITKMKSQRLEPQDAEAFPLISWQDALSALKVFATEGVIELKTIHDGDNAALAKIGASNSKISDMKCWRTSKLKAQKHFFELLCPFRLGKCYHTSSLPSPFTVVSITDQKKSYFISFYRLLLLNPVTYYLSPVMGSVKRCHPQRKYRSLKDKLGHTWTWVHHL